MEIAILFYLWISIICESIDLRAETTHDNIFYLSSHIAADANNKYVC
jgi:hypothetical protein